MNGVNQSLTAEVMSTDELVQLIRGSLLNTPRVQAIAPQAAKVPQTAAAFQADLPVAAPITNSTSKPSRFYALVFAFATIVGLVGVWKGNTTYGPEMYGATGMVPVAEAHASNKNYAVFDLNLNIRALRDQQLARLSKTPEIILLGASHWQEGHRGIAQGLDFFNAHIHRDYWEDLLGMVDLLIRHDRLPKKLIISIRDNQFAPVGKRKDFLWEPGIPAYREMAARLGIEPESYWKTLPYDRMRALLSLPMLFDNLTRWHNASERPGPTDSKQSENLDMLLPDGSIVWSAVHKQLFSQERAMRESIAFVNKRLNDPPVVDPKGVAAFDTLLTFLKEKGVEVYLINPPFNPIFYDAVQGSPYAEGLGRIETLMQDIATRHNIPLLGSFNPHKIGCEAVMYIDAEHSNEKCLTKLLEPFVAMQRAKGGA